MSEPRDKHKTIEVNYCANCPFVSSTENRDEPWLCDAIGAQDGHSDPRELPEQRIHPEPWPEPPDWCPLRHGDRLVTLRVR
jgi:hypothetical protein